MTMDGNDTSWFENPEAETNVSTLHARQLLSQVKTLEKPTPYPFEFSRPVESVGVLVSISAVVFQVNGVEVNMLKS